MNGAARQTVCYVAAVRKRWLKREREKETDRKTAIVVSVKRQSLMRLLSSTL